MDDHTLVLHTAFKVLNLRININIIEPLGDQPPGHKFLGEQTEVLQ